MIKALRVHALSEDLSGLAVENIALAAPQANEVRVNIMATALNFPDLLMCSGGYQLKPELPFTPGMEASGIISACGEAVSDWQIGDEVVCGARFGLMASAANLPEAAVSAKPRLMDWCQAAAWRVAWLTAYVALVARGNLKRGETLLVLGAAGGVGLAAVDIGRKIGARIFAVASSEDKRALTKHYGADLTFAADENLAANIKDATQGKGVDIAYDPVGGDMFDAARRSLGWQGRLLVIGFASGQRPSLPVNYALIKGLSIIGVRAGEYGRRDPEKGKQVETKLLQWANEGEIKPHIGARFPLDESVEALRMLGERRALGKICVIMR